MLERLHGSEPTFSQSGDAVVSPSRLVGAQGSAAMNLTRDLALVGPCWVLSGMWPNFAF